MLVFLIVIVCVAYLVSAAVAYGIIADMLGMKSLTDQNDMWLALMGAAFWPVVAISYPLCIIAKKTYEWRINNANDRSR